jgi:hypothetical protein
VFAAIESLLAEIHEEFALHLSIVASQVAATGCGRSSPPGGGWPNL